MIALPLFPARRLFGAVTASCLAAFFLAGCQTPDLKPFATASAAVATSINQGGDLAIAPLAQTAVVSAKGERIEPGDPKHPAKKLAELWEARRKTATALLAYSAALAAIADASAHRAENAKTLVKSVNDLASAVGANLITDAAGNLVGKILETGVEVKANHDLSAAVQSADSAIQLIAKALDRDFAALSREFQSLQQAKRFEALDALAPVDDFYRTVVNQRDQQRVEVAKALADSTKKAERPALEARLAELDAMLAHAEPDWTARRADLNRVLATLETGKAFFAAAQSSVGAWATAHQDIAAALKEKRLPNIVVLVARAQELNGLIENLKASK